MTLKLQDLEVYQLAMEIGESVWKCCSDWNFFAKDTIGKQCVRAADSVAANIAEGYGRYHYKENKLFVYYARGSLMELRSWLDKAHGRNLFTAEGHSSLTAKLDILHLKLNAYLKSIGKHSQ